jgi:hypothetical protein
MYYFNSGSVSEDTGCRQYSDLDRIIAKFLLTMYRVSMVFAETVVHVTDTLLAVNMVAST